MDGPTNADWVAYLPAFPELQVLFLVVDAAVGLALLALLLWRVWAPLRRWADRDGVSAAHALVRAAHRGAGPGSGAVRTLVNACQALPLH